MGAGDPFGRPAVVPLDLTREGRIQLLRAAARALMAVEPPPPAAALFLRGALGAWLAAGGDLARDFLRVSAPRGSHLRPERIASSLTSAKGVQTREDFDTTENARISDRYIKGLLIGKGHASATVGFLMGQNDFTLAQR